MFSRFGPSVLGTRAACVPTIFYPGSPMKEGIVECCICRDSVVGSAAAKIVIYPPGAAEDEAQTLWAHNQCLRKQIRADVPLHPNLLDESQ